MDRLKGKVAIVTGGASGIGRAIIKLFTKEGASVLTIDVDEEGGKSLVNEIKDVIFQKGDVSKEEDVEKAVKTCIEKFGAIDVLVNNAGVEEISMVSEMSLETWNRVISINLTGAFLFIKKSVPHMITRGKGKIINISSVAASVGGPFLSAYSSSKGGILGLTKSLAVELAGMNINVNAIQPGFIHTKMTEIPLSVEEIRKDVINRTPLGRIGDPLKDVAPLAVYLASDESDFVTGQCIIVDGGYSVI